MRRRIQKGFTPLNRSTYKRYLTGFTLVELLLAMTLFSIIAVTIYSTFRSGITAWRKVEEVSSTYKDLRLVLDRISVELRNSQDMGIFDFEGTGDKLTFVSVLDKYRPDVGREPVIAKISYFLEAEKRKGPGSLLS